MNHRTMLGRICLVSLVAFALLPAEAAEPPLIRFGHGFAAEEQVWLMAARPDLTPGQGTKYRLKFVSFQGNPSASRLIWRTSSTAARRRVWR